ncbi:MAG: DUF2088 domain-containing protein, partial [Ruminococcaceae bacterium]|nr:DUF2088 domain-containing protein [Oscillospiraceae bacterium]
MLDELNLPLAAERLAAILTPNHIAQAAESQENIVRKALDNPIGTRPLRELAVG